MSYERKSAKVRALANDPTLLTDVLSRNTQDAHEVLPELVPAMHATATTGLAFLDSKLPKPANQLPLDHEWEPSHDQKEQWLGYHEIVDDPIRVLEHVKNGTLTNSHMEALHSVYPDLLKDMQERVMENMSGNSARDINYTTKLAVSKFLGMPADNGMLPGVVQANQAAFQGAKQQDGSAGSGKSTQSGLSKLKVGELSETQTQDLNGKDKA